MVFKDYKMKGYTLHTIKTDKFKMCHVEVIFRNNVVKEEITKRNLLFDMLCECSNSYKGKRDLALELENLYCALRGSPGSNTFSLIFSFSVTMWIGFILFLLSF